MRRGILSRSVWPAGGPPGWCAYPSYGRKHEKRHWRKWVKWNREQQPRVRETTI